MTYRDNTTTVVSQNMSDWLKPQGYPGESTAGYSPRVTKNGSVESLYEYLFGYSLAINSAKTVKSISLLATRDVVILSVALVSAS